MHVIVNEYNEVYFKLQTNYEVNAKLKNYLSCYIKNYWFNPKYKAGRWDGKISFYNISKKLLPIGLYSFFRRFCRENNIKYKLNFDVGKYKNDISNNELEEFYRVLFNDSSFKLRDYQKTSIERSIKRKRGIILSATGSGKSIVLYTLIRYLLDQDKDVLIVVPNTTLVEQLYNDFRDYGWQDLYNYVCKLYSGMEYDSSKPILLSTWQSLYKKDSDFFQRFQGLMIDECLHPQTPITMADGSKKNIEDINIGDKVMSYNKDMGKIEAKKVLKVYTKSSDNLYRIKDGKNIYFKNGITGNHGCYVKNGLKRVDELKDEKLIKYK